MRLQQYINEEILDKDIDFIRKNCQPWIDMVQKYNTKNVYLYRGMKNRSDFSIIKVRKNRKPMDINEYVHEMLDDILEKKFGWKVRSESIFCFSYDPLATTGYGSSNIVIPIGKFDYLWSKKSKDLYYKINKNKVYKFIDKNSSWNESLKEIYNIYKKEIYNFESFNEFKKFIYDEFKKFINSLDYKKNTGFKEMMDNYEGEITIHCDKYVASKYNMINYYKISSDAFGILL